MNTTSLSCSLLALGLALPAQAPPPVKRTVEDLLPASTFASVRFGGLDACLAAADELPAGAVIQRFLEQVPPETRAEHLDQWLDQAGSQVRKVLQRQGIAPADLRALLSCEHVVGVGRPTIEGMGPSVALLVAAGNNGDAIERLAAAVEAMGARHRVLAGTKDVEIHGVKARQWVTRDGPPIYVASVGGTFVLTNSRGYLAEIGAVARGEQPALAKGSTLGRVRGRMPGEMLASMFANTKRLCSMADPVLPYEISEWADVLGIGKLDGVYAATSAGDHGATDVLHVGLRGSTAGLFKVAASRPLDLSVAQCCSADTVVFGAMRCDVPGLIGAFDRFLDLLPAEAGDEARREIHEEMSRELRRLGTSPQEIHGLLEAFGDQMAVALSLEKSAVPKPELMVRIDVRDAEKIAALLLRIEAIVADETGLEWKERRVDGTAVRFVNVDVEQQFKLSPCYALTDDALMIGSDTACLVRALRTDPEDSLAAQDDFVEMGKAAAGAFGVLHLRLFRASELGWRTAETMLFPQLDAHADEIGFDSEALPDGEELSAALGTSTVAAFVDESGFTLVNHGTLGWGTWLAAFGTVADDVLGRASRSSPKIY